MCGKNFFETKSHRQFFGPSAKNSLNWSPHSLVVRIRTIFGETKIGRVFESGFCFRTPRKCFDGFLKTDSDVYVFSKFLGKSLLWNVGEVIILWYPEQIFKAGVFENNFYMSRGDFSRNDNLQKSFSNWKIFLEFGQTLSADVIHKHFSYILDKLLKICFLLRCELCITTCVILLAKAENFREKNEV